MLDWWSQGLSAMLEKIFGCSLITKLRSILLMEADFNATNKMIYGVRMLTNVCKYQLMPEEVFSEWNHLTDDGTLSKILNCIGQLVWPHWMLITVMIVSLNQWHQWFFNLSDYLLGQ